jgi:hypothetical protein
MANEEDVIRIDLASDTSEGEEARKKLGEIGDQVDKIAPAFDRARDASGRFAKSLADGQEARKVGALTDNHATYATARDTYDLDLPHRASANSVGREEEGFRKLTAAMAAHERVAASVASSEAKVASSATAAGNAVARAGTNAGKAGQLMTSLGYAADDLQYGFKGLSNNIQPIVSQIPALAGFAGAISIGAIAAYQLYEHWDQVVGLFGQGLPQPALTGPELLADNIRKATDELELLTKKSTLAWHELERLGKLKLDIAEMTKDAEAQKAVDAAGKKQSKAEQAVGSGFAEAMAESGGKDAQDEFLGKLRDNADARGLVYNEAKGRMDTPENAARDMAAAALAGDKISRDAIAKMLDDGSRFKANIEKFSPEHIQKQKDYKKQVEDEKKAEQEALDEEYAQAQRNAAEKKRIEDAQEKARKDALDKATKATAGTGLNAMVDDALLREALKSGAETGAASKAVKDQLSKELRAKGLSAEEADSAAGDIVAKHAAALGDEINQNSMQPKHLDAPDRIASVDFARKVEASGARTMDAIAGNTQAMKDQLAELVAFKRKGPRLD